MKHILTGLIALMFLALVACEGPAGPAGAQGPKGDAGLNAGFVYFEGFKDSLQCGTCHTTDADTTFYKAARTFQWANSKHANGGHSFENGTSCQECHTQEGYVKKQLGVTITALGNTSPIGCFACHSPHKNGDFSLRTTSAVSLYSNLAGVADYSFDYGKGNLCASCHRPRTQSVKLDPSKSTSTDAVNDSIRITSGRWYSHYGVQSQMLLGKGGYEWANGPVVIENSMHTNAPGIKSEGCVACHMPNAVGNMSGGHTMIINSEEEGENLAGCKTCHNGTGAGNITKLDYNGKMTEVARNLDTLKSLLVAVNWLNDTTMQVRVPLTIKPSNRAGALWNFFLVEHDLSEGVHNTKYANALLRNSIAKMRGQF